MKNCTEVTCAKITCSIDQLPVACPRTSIWLCRRFRIFWHNFCEQSTPFRTADRGPSQLNPKHLKVANSVCKTLCGFGQMACPFAPEHPRFFGSSSHDLLEMPPKAGYDISACNSTAADAACLESHEFRSLQAGANLEEQHCLDPTWELRTSALCPAWRALSPHPHPFNVGRMVPWPGKRNVQRSRGKL